MGFFPGTSAALVCLLVWSTAPAAAQNARLELQKTRYELRAGEPLPLAASRDTLDFLLSATTRSVTIDGATSGGLVAAPNHAGDQMLLAASARLKRGTHTVKISATSAAGEQRETTLEVVADALTPVPNNATRPPVVLLNGWVQGFTGGCPLATSSAITFGNLAQYLIADGVPVVYLFDNCAEDANQTVEQLGNDLGTFLNAIHYVNGSQVEQIDLVAFSLGGLIARSYLAGLQPQSGVVLNPPADTLVRKLVLIATPNFGSYVAGTYAAALAGAMQSSELIPGSSLLWNLGTWNQFGDDLRGVDAIAVVGNAGAYNATVANASDGLVSLTSAALGFAAQDTSLTRIVPYCHIDPAAFTNIALGTLSCFSTGIANVTDPNQLTGQIVRSFLAGTSAWKSIGTTPPQNPYLSVNGGVLFALIDTNGNFVKDISKVQWGSVMLSAGGDTGTIFWDDMVSGTAQFVVTSQSRGTVTCPMSKNPVGYIAVTRCKYNATITSVSPLAGGSGKAVAAGAALTLNGAGFGATQCANCNVTATPASGSAQTLTVSSWGPAAIGVTIPASVTGLVTLTVTTAISTDSMNVMVVPGTPAIGTSPASLQFSYTLGSSAPDPQTLTISNSGGGTLTWTATVSDSWLSVTPSSGTAPSSISVSVATSGMGVGSYTGSIQVTASGVSSPVSIPVTLNVTQASQGGMNIAAVVNAASSQPGLASATWISIFGTNLAPATDSWQASSFVNGALPASLDGVSVTINGQPAYVAFVSPGQINVLAPDDPATGAVQVQVTSGQQQSNSFTVQKTQFAPAFFEFGSGPYVAALHADYSAVGNPGLLSGVASTPAVPGEVIQIYGTGFGPANPPVPTGQVVTSPSMLANDVQVTIGGAAATVQYAGLVGPGLYQLNVLVPQLSAGDAPVVARIGGGVSQTGASITIGQ